jgi:hypothetical protein
MTLRKLTAAVAFTVAAGLALPAAAEAGHRHSRSCSHRSSYGNYRGSYSYQAPRYSYDRYGYDRYGYDSYRYYDPYVYSRSYDYRPYRYVRPYRYPAPIYRYRSRPHVSIHLDF